MSELDIRALDANFTGWRTERVPGLAVSKAFERYAVEQVLKDDELDDNDVSFGLLGEKDDGGVDGMYLFMNGNIIEDDTELPDPTLTVELALIQAKFETGFGETAIEKLHAFTRDLLDYSRSPNTFNYLNQKARERIALFREKYDAVIGSSHKLTISYHYATKSDQSPNPKVEARVKNLKQFVNERFSAALVPFEFWGCQRLLEAARRSPTKDFPLYIEKNFNTDDGAVVCLVNLKKFHRFLSDEHGSLVRRILEPNVRGYQGKRNPVNADIRKTLSTTQPTDEFWWLNNGITILAERATLAGNRLTIGEPEIVNGLQTSQEIHSFFKENPDRDENRHILVRVIIPPRGDSRNRIIKATNFQTPVNPVSLHAADPVHLDIEELLRLYDLYYDRRKGDCKLQKRPIAKTVSIRDLARAVIAIVLQQPDSARARPATLLNDDKRYLTIFNDGYDRKVYLVCIVLMRQIDEYLEQRADISPDSRTDIRFYVGLWLACALAGSATPSVQQIAALETACVKVPIPVDALTAACSEVMEAYVRLGATDVVAKGPDLKREIIAKIQTRFGVPGS